MESRQGHFAQFIRFGVTGAINTAVDAAVFAALLYLGSSLYLAQVCGYGAGMVNSYLINRRWTFDSREKLLGPLALRFFAANLCLLGLSLGVVHVLGTLYGLPIIIVKAAAVCVTVGLGFLINRMWVFKQS